MNVEDITSEKDILLFIGTRLNGFTEMLDKIWNTKDTTFFGTEVSLPLYEGRKRTYGGGRCDMLFGNKEMIIPVELKYKANERSYYQISKYVDLISKLDSRKPKGILICMDATKELMNSEIDDDIAIVEMSTGRVLCSYGLIQ